MKKLVFDVRTEKDLLDKVEVEVKVSTDFRFYFDARKLPEILKEGADGYETKWYFDSIYELKKNINQRIEQHERRFIEDRKETVIVYMFNAKTPNGNHNQIRIKFAWEKLEKVTTYNNQTTYFKRSSTPMYGERLDEIDPKRKLGFDVVGPDNVNEMSWTKEREEWFSRMTKAFEQLVSQLNDGLIIDPILLSNQIDNGTNLLQWGKTNEKGE
jgi:hypothetical protein